MIHVLNIRYILQGCIEEADKLRLCNYRFTVDKPFVALLPFLTLAFATLFWRKPVVTVFVLFGSTVLIEGFKSRFPDASTDLIPFWRNFSSSGIAPVPFSPAELFIVVGVTVWFVRGLFSQNLKVHGGPVLRSYSWYLLIVIVAFLNGAVTGGDLRIALWEVRLPVYSAAVFFLAINLLQSRRHIEALGWIIILGSGLKGLQGTWRYFVTLGRNVWTSNNILEHEEALFFPAYSLFLLLMFILGGSQRQKRVALLLLPFVLIADFANKRRASTASLMVALVVLVFILLTVMVEHRRRILQGMLVALILVCVYAGVYWNSGSRLAQPIRAVKSQIWPSSRDESSDLYRELEDRNLRMQISQNPIVGRGYGIEMPLLPGMWDARKIAPFILYMPHNSVLWVWWRTGLIGFAVFWMAVGVAIIRNCFLARTTTDPYIQRWATFAVLVTVMWSVLGSLDQGLLLYREVVYVWIVLAVPEVLRRLNNELRPAQASIGASTWSS